MQLSKSIGRNELLETLKSEGVVETSGPPSPLSPGLSTSMKLTSSNPSNDPVHIAMEEKLSITANRDGGIQNLEVKGQMMLRITDPQVSQVKLLIKMPSDSSGINFQVRMNLKIFIYLKLV